MSGSMPHAAEWVRVAATDEIGSSPVPVSAGGGDFVLVRLHTGGPPAVFAAHCPHRLVPLAAAKVVEGTLQCAYHGWRFGPDGRCVAVPSLTADANLPPRAHLAEPPEVCELAGEVWLRPLSGQTIEQAPRGITNLDPALRRAWHPVALASELDSGPCTIRLLGQDWRICQDDGGLSASPPPYAVVKRWGLVWLAPEEPLDDLFDEPDLEDRDYVGAWLPPARTNVSVGHVADNFLDVAHFPFVHAATFGPDTTVVEPYEVQPETSGFRSVQVQPFDNPEDPGVAAGQRPLRQQRRATYVYRAPFQLMLRLEEIDAGAVKTILFFGQPEDLTSTRIYTKMLLRGIGGIERPGPDVLAREVAFEEAVLAEDLALQRGMDATGLPLDLRDELHVRADRLGVALRRELRRFTERAVDVAP
ncbi:MAG: aromatic ring-hydroxylating dioxygenase subunit alpha [Actinomycetota bacterium]|nr:aromatic ring-hydroxylating dioxygenase subunit alpha [Actinomycetota bacterium]